jgi:ABC-type Fe3+/spermidine/putrescine transport system ATPase subunit
MITLEHVSLALGEFSLHDVDLHVSRNEYLVIIGPSGAGKTVLLELIAGLRLADRGRIIIGGSDAGGIPPEKRHLALVYQNYSLFPHMTAFENIAYGLRLRGIAGPEIDHRVRSLLAEFGIAQLADHYPSTMSGGEQQRVAIARALATDPAVLLLDEPFASLDPRSRDDCIRVMQELRDVRKITILQVSHSGDEAYALADRVAVLIGGRIAQTGTPDGIFCHPRSTDVAQFVGMENVMTGTVLHSGDGMSRIGINTAVVAVLLPGAAEQGERVSIGIPAGRIRIMAEKPVSEEQSVNCLPCTVTRVTRGPETATLALAGSIPLTAVMRRSGDDRHVPRQGTDVYAVFLDSDVRVLSAR